MKYTSLIFLLILITCKHQKHFLEGKKEERGVPIHNIEIKKGFEYKICTKESKSVEFCLEVYKPVCGWFVESPEQCKDKYCRESFANDCFACKDKRVIGYTEGNCK